MSKIATDPINKLIIELRGYLRADQILYREAELRAYDTDATSLFKNKPKLVVLPNSAKEVAKILKLINIVNMKLFKNSSDTRQTNSEGPELTYASMRIPKNSDNEVAENFGTISYTARGAGTGLSGGAIAAANSVIISLARLNRLIKVNSINQTAIVEVGLVNAALSEQIKHTGLHFSPDPSSQNACTIGGNIAENAGGIHCYKHGVTSEQILGLEIVTHDGEIQYLGALNKEGETLATTNIDLTKLFVGSEGTFGIATKALVKLKPIPESFITIQMSFASIIDAARVISLIIEEGFKPTALEMIDHGAIQAVNHAYNLNIKAEVQAILILEFDGDNEEVLLDARKIKELINSKSNEFKVIDYEETQDPIRKKFLWKVRKGTVAAFGQIAPFWYLYDSVVPRSKIPEAVAGIETIAAKHNLILASVMHAADGNLHPNFLYDPDKDPDVIQRIHAASKELMLLCIELGGVLSGEHGIGVEKQEYMPYMFSDNDMEQMMKVRRIFDPNMNANPNKVFPIRICKHC